MSWFEYIDQVMNSGSRLVFCRSAWRTPAVQLFLVPGIWEARNCCLILYVTINMTVGWGGWVGWAKNVHLHSHTYVMPRYCTSSCTCTHTLAALRYVLLHLHTYVMPCTWLTVAGTSSTVGCHAAPQPCKSQAEPSLV